VRRVASRSWHRGDPQRREVTALSDGRLQLARSQKGLGTNLTVSVGLVVLCPSLGSHRTGKDQEKKNLE
jgi:hypothetical protein